MKDQNLIVGLIPLELNLRQGGREGNKNKKITMKQALSLSCPQSLSNSAKSSALNLLIYSNFFFFITLSLNLNHHNHNCLTLKAENIRFICFFQTVTINQVLSHGFCLILLVLNNVTFSFGSMFFVFASVVKTLKFQTQEVPSFFV